jgi:hypothetical protein
MKLEDIIKSLRFLPKEPLPKPIGKGVKIRAGDGSYVVVYPEHFKLFLEFQELRKAKRVEVNHADD